MQQLSFSVKTGVSYRDEREFTPVMSDPLFVVYALPDFVLTLTQHIAMPEHQHHALQLTIAREGSFCAHVGGASFTTRALLIGSNQPHATPTCTGVLINFLLEPEGEVGRQWTHALLNDSPIHVIAPHMLEALQPLLDLIDIHAQLPAEQVQTLFDTLTLQLTTPVSAAPPRDERITQALSALLALDEKRISAEALASSLALSESRLLHLFKAEMGTTLRAFLLWLRFGRALQAVWAGATMTEAAYEAGFADAAHLSRTAAQIFGRPLNSLFKNPEQYRVYFYTQRREQPARHG